jgi:intracellular sulfur oxidation DsrE/DsrF family protein
MRRFTFGSVLLLVCGSSLSQQQNPLIDGASIQMDGVVALVLRGNNAYIVIKPGQPYAALFDNADHRN